MASVYEFSDDIYHYSAASWSKDFRLAVCTVPCVRILTMNVEPLNMDQKMLLRQSHIPAEKHRLDIPKYDPNQNVDLLQKLPREEVNRLIPDKIMNPFQYSQDDLKYTSFLSAEWSPRGADKLGRCILATLSMDNRLVIYSQMDSEYQWTKIADLTSLRRKETFPGAAYKSYTKYQEYRKWCYDQAISAISWCPQIFTDEKDGSKYSILAAGAWSGTVVLWKIKLPCLEKSDCTVMSTNTDYGGKINCMTWSQNTGLLTVAHHDADLVVGTFNTNTGDITWTHLDTCTDLPDVSYITFCNKCLENEEILAVLTHQYIDGYHLRLTENNKWSLISTGGKRCHGSNATGMIALEDKSCMISHIDGVIETAAFSSSSNNCTAWDEDEKESYTKKYIQDFSSRIEDIQVEVVRYEHENENNMRYYALAMSPNRAFLSFVKRPSIGYDHLSPQWRSPTKVYLHKIKDDSPDHVFSRLVDYKGPLSEVTDIVECYRLCIVQNPSVVFNYSNPMSRRELVLRRFEISLKIVITKNEEDIKKRTKGDQSAEVLAEQIVDLNLDYKTTTYRIMGVHIEQCVKCLKQQASITQSDSSILHHFLQFIQSHSSVLLETINIEEIRTSISNMLEGHNYVPPLSPVCSSDMKLVDLSWESPNGHKFGTCCFTLQPCVDIDYRKCVGCPALALPLNDLKDYPWLQDTVDLSSCVFCESLIL